ncbi:MAG TPA: adenosine deaminase, partial [Kofleriaceae bacterium]|nr:adenosine deaminase [Kofleriaceae bacterium]
MTAEIPFELIQALPKTDLHCHLDGSLRLDTVIDLAKKQQVKLPTFDRTELFHMLYAGEHVTSLDDYLR